MCIYTYSKGAPPTHMHGETLVLAKNEFAERVANKMRNTFLGM